MALTKCRECGKEVSSEAKQCPHCGIAAPVKKSGGRRTLYFLLAVLGLLVVNNTVKQPATQTEATVAAPGPRAAIRAEGVRARLNFATGQMTLSARLQAVGAERPTRAWLWAFFVNPGEGIDGSRSDQPIEVQVDWRGQDTVTVTGSGPFHWASTNGVPRSGYLARVYASAAGAGAVQIPPSRRNKTPTGMLAVEVR